MPRVVRHPQRTLWREQCRKKRGTEPNLRRWPNVERQERGKHEQHARIAIELRLRNKVPNVRHEGGHTKKESAHGKNEHGKLEIIERYIKYRVKSTFVSKKQVLEIAKSIEF